MDATFLFTSIVNKANFEPATHARATADIFLRCVKRFSLPITIQ
jgi:hypothetical protein